MNRTGVNSVSQLIVTTAAVGVLCAALLIGTRSHTPHPVLAQDIGSEIVKKAQQGRFDEAVQVGLQALHNDPSDEFIYEQIADVYLIRAGKESQHKEQWVLKAAFYTEKALSLNSKDRDAAGVHLLQEARSFEVAGDLATAKRCAYYDKARRILESRVPLLQGDQIVIEGKAFPLAPLRKENEKRLADVGAKVANAGCNVAPS